MSYTCTLVRMSCIMYVCACIHACSHGLMCVTLRKEHVWLAFPMYERERDGKQAADVGERSEKGTCAWGDIGLAHSLVVFNS